MSGIASIFRRDGGVPDAAVHEKMLDALAHCGGDGRGSVLLGSTLLGHQHAWLTPEEVAERQPLVDPGGRWAVAFDGRLDEREELAAQLGLEPAACSDAQLVLAGYERWGDGVFPRLLGPFALVVQDVWRRRVILARDPMGERTLYYRLGRERLLVASEEAALLAHPDVSGEADEESIARYFALAAPLPGRTLFRDVRELRPGHVLVVDAASEHQTSFWRPPSGEGGPARSDDDWAEELLDVLRRSVRCRMRGTTGPAVLMSGGLDSTTVAALAAEELARDDQPLPTFSWTFDELPGCDESRFIDRMGDRWRLDGRRVAGDAEWPLRDLASWPVDPGRAYSDPYARLVALAYRRAREAGHRVLLTGYWGDQLFSSSGWLGGLLRERRLGEAVAAVGSWAWRYRRDPRVWSRAGRAVAGRVTGRAPAPRSWTGFLTEETRRRMADGPQGAVPDPGDLLEGFHVWMATGRAQLARRLGMELSDPLRDRRLVELVLAMPAHQLNRGGTTRYVLRRAMRGLLPEEVRRRGGKTSLEGLFRRGLEREGKALRELLEHPEAAWKDYVRHDALAPLLASPAADHPAELHRTAWLAVGFELWNGNRMSRLGTRHPPLVRAEGAG